MRKLNLLDLAAGLILLALFAAFLVQLFVPNALRQNVLDEASRPTIKVVAEANALFLRDRMHPGDRQLGEHDRVEAELISFELSEKLTAVWKLRAREWRGWLQFGESVLKPGEQLHVATPGYHFIGTIVEVLR